MPARIDLNAELLNEFSQGVQVSFASFLAALTEATHPRHGEDMLPVAQRSLTELIERWQAALYLTLPLDLVRSRFPLAQPATQHLIDGLLTLALYSEPESASGWESIQKRVHQLFANLDGAAPMISDARVGLADVA